MALAPCPKCEKLVSTHAMACPQCGTRSPHASNPLAAVRSWPRLLAGALPLARRYPWRATFFVIAVVWIVSILLALLSSPEMLAQAIYLFPVVSLTVLSTVRAAVAMTSTTRPVRDTVVPSAVIGGIVLVVWVRPLLQEILGEAGLAIAFGLIVVAGAIGGTIAYVRSQSFPAELVDEYRAARYGRSMLWLGVLLAAVPAGAFVRAAMPMATSATYMKDRTVPLQAENSTFSASRADYARWVGIATFFIAYCLIGHGVKLLQWEAASRAVVEIGRRETFAEFVNRSAHTGPPPS